MKVIDTIGAEPTQHGGGIPGINDAIIIRIGITGHKDFVATDEESDPEIRECEILLRRILNRRMKLVMNYLDSLLTATRRRYIVVSSLAEGGDIILTESILGRENSKRTGHTLTSKLRVILPMPKEDYLQEFRNSEQKRIFHELIGESENVEIATSSSKNAADDDNSGRYKAAAEAVIRKCDILIAAWDGKPTEKSAGTAATVAEALRQGKPVIHFHTPRLNEFRGHRSGIIARDHLERAFLPLISLCRRGLARFGRPFGITIINGDDSVLTALDHLNTFNLDGNLGVPGLHLKELDLVEKETSESYDAFRRSLKDEKAMAYFDSVFGDHLRQGILPTWSKASLLAEKFQRRYNRWRGTFVYLMAAAAVSTGAFILLFQPLNHLLYWIEVVEVLSILTILLLSRHFDWHRKRTEYRALSERLRAATLLSIARIIPDELTGEARDQASITSNSWVEKIFEGFMTHIQRGSPTRPLHRESLRNLLLKAWLEHQFGYYRTRSSELHRRYLALEIASLLLFSGTLIIAVVHALHLIKDSYTLTVFHFLSLSLPAIGGAIGGIMVHREYKRNSHRYHQMSIVLERLIYQAKEAEGLPALKAVFRRAYYLMLREQQTWFATVGVEPPNPT